MKTGFVTFWHVAASIDHPTNQGNPLEFLGAQVLLVSPILFFLIVAGMYRFRDTESSLRFCWAVSAIFFGIVFLASFFKKVQGNWAVAAYPTAFVIMVHFASKRALQAGVALSLATILAVLVLPIPFTSNPFKTGIANEHLAKALKASGYIPGKDFLFSDRYQLTSLLSFYGPEQRTSLFF